MESQRHAIRVIGIVIVRAPRCVDHTEVVGVLTFAERSQTLQAEQMLYSLKPKHNYEEVLPAFSLRKRALSVFLTP